MENWLPVPGHEGKYEVSDLGRIRSLISDLVLKPSTSGGYPRVILSQPYRSAPIHHLVAEVFIGPRPAGLEIRHKDGNRSDCRASNLEYGTRSDNSRDSIAHGTHFNAGLTHCKRGHEFTSENLQKTSSNKRTCLACRRERQALYDSGQSVMEVGMCPKGHPKTPENRYPNGNGKTRCKPCALDKKKVAA